MKRIPLCLLIVVFAFMEHLFADPVQEAEQAYGFNSSSNYQQLLSAIGPAYTDFNSSYDPIALIAMDKIMNYVESGKKIQFNYDFFLQNNDLSAKLAAAKGINSYLRSGLSADAPLKLAIGNKLWQDMGAVTINEESKSFIRTAVITLLLLLDDRGLDAILTDKDYIKTLQIEDKWSPDSSASVFSGLKSKYEGLVGQKAGADERAAIYELCRLRKLNGAARIESNASVVNFETW